MFILYGFVCTRFSKPRVIFLGWCVVCHWTCFGIVWSRSNDSNTTTKITRQALKKDYTQIHTPDDGCKYHPKNVELTMIEMKNTG
jgi:hypothetical protein